MSLHVLIAGAGIGGLALAHGLRKAGVSHTVFERDPSPGHRRQGYRIHIDADGHAALRECLPERLYELYLATSTSTPAAQLAVFFDHRFVRTGAGDPRVGEARQDRPPTAVNRMTLREILLSDLGENVHFGRELTGFDQDGTGVHARFGDGATASGDVLVAADGINSALRRQLLPQATVHDTRVRAITGKTPLAALPGGLPDELDNSFTGVHGPGFRTLALAPYRSRRPHRQAAAELAPGAVLTAVPDYLMWLQLARIEDYPYSDEELFGAGPQVLHRLALEMIEGWHPQLRALVEHAQQPETFPLAIRAIPPVPPWSAGAVTLLGDAVHAMPPIGGRGGNTALRDAAALTTELHAVARGQRGLPQALARYEEGLRDRGDAAVMESLHRSGPSIGARAPDGTDPFADATSDVPR